MGSEEYYNMMMIKGKRSKRQRQLHASSSSLALTMATSSSSTSSSDQQLDDTICMIRCDNDDKTTQVEQDMADCLILLAQGGESRKSPTTTTTIKDLFMYQCKTCDRSFPSFQALGGHRASHKRPKAGSTTDALINQHESSSSIFNHDNATACTTNTILSLHISSSRSDQYSCGIKISNGKSSSKVHECSICGAEFTSGQALGGHMRRHRSSLLPRAAMPSPNHDQSDNEVKKAAGGANVFSLDLNLPAPEDMDQQIESKFPFAMNEQVIVFSSSSAMVDCHL